MRLALSERTAKTAGMKMRLLLLTIAVSMVFFAGCASHPDCKVSHKPKQQRFAANAAFGGPKQGIISVADPVNWSPGGTNVGAVECHVIGQPINTKTLWRPYIAGNPAKPNELINASPWTTIPCDANYNWRARFAVDAPHVVPWPKLIPIQGGKKTVITVSYYQ